MMRISLFLIALSIGASSLLGCGGSGFNVTEDFEDFCADTPCRWEAVGPVSQVQTYHPGSHGVAIPAGSTLTALEGFGTLQLFTFARCDEDASLEINGSTLPVPASSFVWRPAPQQEYMVISVSGDGECIIDDVGF